LINSALPLHEPSEKPGPRWELRFIVGTLNLDIAGKTGDFSENCKFVLPQPPGRALKELLRHLEPVIPSNTVAVRDIPGAIHIATQHKPAGAS
jgi:hypothetical protein